MNTAVISLSSAVVLRGQERETAQKYLSKKAKEFGMEAQELVGLSRKLDPSIGVEPAAVPVLDATVTKASEMAARLASFIRRTQTTEGAQPLSNEFAVALLLAAFKQLEN